MDFRLEGKHSNFIDLFTNHSIHNTQVHGNVDRKKENDDKSKWLSLFESTVSY